MGSDCPYPCRTQETRASTTTPHRAVSSCQVAEEAVQRFFEFYTSNATVDTHLADQLLLYMALAKGSSSIITNHLTEHTRTNLWLIEKFLPITFHVAGELGKRATIRIG
ncbi:MAG: RNA 3'-terminal phosphate cyclase [Gloeobacterales cyanobacterium]